MDPIVYRVRIDRVLERHGLSREQFVAAAGVSLASYRCYRRGVRSPSAEVVIAVERLGIQRHELRPDLWPPPGRRKASACRKAA
jgi:transcriptional regulator with XRE-family HTH domain